jgi:hypothetical protein
VDGWLRGKLAYELEQLPRREGNGTGLSYRRRNGDAHRHFQIGCRHLETIRPRVDEDVGQDGERLPWLDDVLDKLQSPQEWFA